MTTDAKKPRFYAKIINVENVDKIATSKEKDRFVWRAIFFVIYANGAGLVATIVGFNFGLVFTICMFVFILYSIFRSVWQLVKQYRFIKKYKLFKKEKYFWLIYSINYVLLIGELISACFNTVVTPFENEGFEVKINPVYFLFIFLPLIIIYLIFMHYTHLKYFQDSVIKEHKLEKAKKRVEIPSEDSCSASMNEDNGIYNDKKFIDEE